MHRKTNICPEKMLFKQTDDTLNDEKYVFVYICMYFTRVIFIIQYDALKDIFVGAVSNTDFVKSTWKSAR